MIRGRNGIWGKFRSLDRPGEFVGIVPKARAVEENGRFFVEAEFEAAIESNPSDSCAVRKAEIRTRLLPSSQLALEPAPVRSAALDDELRLTGQQRH